MNVDNLISVSPIGYLVGFVKTDLQVNHSPSILKMWTFSVEENVRLIDYEPLQTSKSLPRHRPRLD